MDSATDIDDSTADPPEDSSNTGGYQPAGIAEVQEGGTTGARKHKLRGTYARATARGEEPLPGDDENLSDDEDSEEEWGEFPGPIKGFDARKIYENLNGQVQQAWEERAETAIFVHHLDGGYGPNMAMNVRTIAAELRSEFPLHQGKPLELTPV